MPNGLRILDQMGMVDKFNEYNVKRGEWEHPDGNGVLQTSHSPGAIFEEKYGSCPEKVGFVRLLIIWLLDLDMAASLWKDSECFKSCTRVSRIRLGFTSRSEWCPWYKPTVKR
jgi:hypothetical protein